MKDPSLLFVCIQNAGRSQMAAALADSLSDGRVRAASAGSAPADRVHPAVVAVMLEKGIDLSSAQPRSLTEVDLEDVDVVVTMGCGDACPVLPGKRYIDWDLPDPADKPLDEVRAIRDEIARHVEELLAALVSTER